MIDGRFLQLLLDAAKHFGEHGAGQPAFNVFSVLHKETDEVNLHSRFLHALLDHRHGGHRKNLEHFLGQLPSKPSVDARGIDPDRAEVKRESDNIDILIRDPDPTSKRALIVENKIGAPDQSRQLWRYAKQQKTEGYSPHLLYLTLDGHAPSEDSRRCLDYECISLISYKEHLLPWLKHCQERAYNDPTLRESIGQYLSLVAALTKTEAYMNDLKNLCMEDKHLHLGLIHDLNKAMIESRVSLFEQLWNEIECKLQKEIVELPHKVEDNVSKKRIENFVTPRSESHDLYSGWHGKYYKLKGSAKLSVEIGDTMHFGVKCRQSEDEYCKFLEALKGEGGSSNSGWGFVKEVDPRMREPTSENFELLTNRQAREKYVAEIVSGVRELWLKIKKANLA